MKCDELEKFDAASNADLSAGYNHRYAYEADEVDAAIAELKAENERLKKCEIWMKQHFYCEEVIACESIKNRRLKRALYKVCDNWAVCEMDYWRKCLEHYEDYFNVITDEDLTEEKCERMIDNWRKVAHNCRAKAEEYK